MTLILRALASGALAIGLLSTAPVTLDRAHGATADRTSDRTNERTSNRTSNRTERQTRQLRHRKAVARKVAHAVGIAVDQKGDPYASGAAGPNAFDCSGLTYFAYRKAGFTHLPRTSAAQAHFARRIHRSAMRRGDLIFFTDGGGVYHVGVYAGLVHGHRWVLHSPYSGARVRTERVWTDQWFPGTLRAR